MAQLNRNYDAFQEQEGGIRLLPEDDYMFEIIEVKDTYTKDNNDYMANVTFRVIQEGSYYNAIVYDNIMFPEPNSPANKIIGRSKRFLHCIDEPYQGDFDVDTDKWIGKTVLAHTGIDEWQGKKKTIISRYLLNESLKDNNSNKQNRQIKSAPVFQRQTQKLIQPLNNAINSQINNNIDPDDDIPF